MLRKEELEHLSRFSSTIKLARKTVLRADSLSLSPVTAVIEGTIGIQHILDDGRRSIAAFYLSGDIIDLRTPGTDQRHDLVALTRATICRLSPAVLDDVLQLNESARAVSVDNLRRQKCLALDHSVDLTKKRALEKVASFVFECRDRQPTVAAEIKLPMQHCDIADYLGLRPETVSRCLHELQDSKMIEQPTVSCITIKDAGALRTLADGTKHDGERAR